MKEIRILDCTLRDGGYCNDWHFGRRNIGKIINALADANIRTVEYGYLEDGCFDNQDMTLYPMLEKIPVNTTTTNLAMINFGKVDITKVPQCSGKVQGLRVAFHKKDKEEALAFCQQLQEKGYMVFVQPMVTNSYSMDEFQQMLMQINQFQPFAFYIVDSFGAMHEDELIQYLKKADSVLDKGIALGFHGHDNSKMAFVNAKSVIEHCENHPIYIDVSTMGMGRGAGNLSTEIFIEYCNRFWNGDYILEPILKMIDEVISHFYIESAWGYTLSYYIAAKNNCHPNYARYLDKKKTLTITNMNEIFHKLSDDKKVSYDETYIEKVYKEYMMKEYSDVRNEDLLHQNIDDKKIVLVAPGKSIEAYTALINHYVAENHCIVMGVNFDYKDIPIDYVFMSNMRRYQEWCDDTQKDNNKLIVTSNIPAEIYFMKVKYADLISGAETVSDNAGLMAIRFLVQHQVKEILLAGFDGYEYEENLNYVEEGMKLGTDSDRKQQMNYLLGQEINKLKRNAKITYLTPSKYEG